jgi:hypothetical protein
MDTIYPRNICITFGECEHEGDMSDYVEELQRAGASVLRAELNEDAECCTVELRIASAAVMQAVEATDAWEFR